MTYPEEKLQIHIILEVERNNLQFLHNQCKTLEKNPSLECLFHILTLRGGP